MAKTLYSQSGKIEYGIKKYVVDTEADKEALNLRTTKMGSKCYVIDTKKWYILNSSNQWIPFVDAGGSGGSGSPFDIKGSVPTIDDLPTEDNAIGDLYIVQEDHSEWVWMTNSENPGGYWEQLGTNISPDSIVQATGQMTGQQASATRENLGAVPKKNPTVVNPIIGEDVGTEGIYFSVWYGEDDNPHCQILGTAVDENVRVRGIAPPEQDQDAANKLYVDGYKYYIYDTTTTISPVANTIYNCGKLTSLTINNPPATKAYSIVFTSGATATTTTFPATILGLENFAAEANTLYEINVLDNRAVVGSWAVSA